MWILEFLTLLVIFTVIVLGVTYIVDPKEVSNFIKELSKRKYRVEDEMSFFNDAEWVKKVILSCNSTTQIWNAYELSKILRKKYDSKVENKIMWIVSDEISKVFDRQYDKLIYK